MKLRLSWGAQKNRQGEIVNYRLGIHLGPTRETVEPLGMLVLDPYYAEELRGILRGGGWREVDGVFESGWEGE